jgi:hypothetical protein
MAVGQVSFKDNKKVKRIVVPQRENPIVNRLNKTKVEKFPDLAMEKEEKLKILRKKDQAARLERVSFAFAFGGNLGLTAWTEEGRGEDCTGAEREEVAEGPCL